MPNADGPGSAVTLAGISEPGPIASKRILSLKNYSGAVINRAVASTFVNRPLTVLLLSPVGRYSSHVQQPMRAAAALDSAPHRRQARAFDRDQCRAGSLHPEVSQVRTQRA